VDYFHKWIISKARISTGLINYYPEGSTGLFPRPETLLDYLISDYLYMLCVFAERFSFYHFLIITSYVMFCTE